MTAHDVTTGLGAVTDRPYSTGWRVLYGQGGGCQHRSRGPFRRGNSRPDFPAHDGGLPIGPAGWIGAMVRPHADPASGTAHACDCGLHDRLLDYRTNRPRRDRHDWLLPL